MVGINLARLGFSQARLHQRRDHRTNSANGCPDAGTSNRGSHHTTYPERRRQRPNGQ
jgi:hypothetical protein